jgi:TonB-linked SusC/RagA family outer membrane protein
MRKKITLLIVILITLSQGMFAQTKRITGKVTGTDNVPIIRATITVSGTTNSTATDAEGNFSITAPQDASLEISTIGFSSQLIKVGGRSTINVQLESGVPSRLDEVVVTGYGSQKKKDIIGAVSVVDVKALQSIPSSSAMQALQGQASGVDVVNNGSPGSPSSIFIRGITGFDNTPLVLIDGIQGDINDVPTSDVESIQVLKDAGAASIYGARGSNGVIIITTKKGKSGAPVISYNSYYNMQIPHKGSELNTISAQQYADIIKVIDPSNGMIINGQLADYFWRGPNGSGAALAGDPAVDPSLYRFNPKDPANNYIIEKVNKNAKGGDMYDAIFNPALMMNQSVTASGGNDKATYLISLSYLDDNGTLKNTSLKRYSLRTNTAFKIGKSFRLGENFNIYYKQNPQAPNNGNFGPILTAEAQLPMIPLFDIGGNYAGPFAGPANHVLGDWSNPLADATLTNNNRNRTYGFIGNVFLEFNFLKNFTARTSLGGVATNFYAQTYAPTQYWKSSGGSNQILTENSGFATTLQWTNTLAYNNHFGNHNINVLVGSESVEDKSRSLLAQGEKFVSDDYNYLVLGNAQVSHIPSSIASEDALFSLFGRIDYSYNDKYLLGFTLRRDGYSAFGPDKKYGVFPAVAIGWRLSQEKFMKGISWITDMKIRASYGILGNKQGIPPTNAYTTYSQGPRFSYYDIHGTGNSLVQGFYPQQNGNAFTSWEQDKLTNVGIDATLFDNHIDLSVEYYKKSVNGLLRPIQAPYTAGEGRSPYVNVGNIENKGVDANVTYRGHVSKDFQFSVGANFTSYKNKIISLPDPGNFDEGVVRFEQGYPMTSFFGYKIIGVFKDAAQVQASAVQKDAAPGRYRYFDANGNDTINSLDRVHLGDANPKFTMGVNLGASYKNFDFSAIIYTSQGNKIYNSQKEWLGSFERGPSGKSTKVLDAWTPGNMNTNIKMNELGRNFSNSGVTNSAFIEDGSFIRLRSVQLGYNFPSKSLKSVGITRLRLYVTGVNLLTITNYSGLDPEVAGTGVGFRGQDDGAYVQEKGVEFGLNASF